MNFDSLVLNSVTQNKLVTDTAEAAKIKLQDELKCKYKNIYMFTFGDGDESVDVYFTDVSRPNMKMFQSRVIGDNKSLPGAQERLCFDCIVHPNNEAVTKLFERFPVAPTKIAAEIVRLGGGTEEDHAKKL